MNRYIKTLLAATLALPMLTSCLEETFPTSGATQEQVDQADKSYIVNSIPAYLHKYTSGVNYDCGMAGLNIWRDASTADLPIYSNSYDYFSYVASGITLGSQWALSQYVWERYYGLIQKTNLAIQTISAELDSEGGIKSEDAEAACTACAYRANAYMEMAQWYEYKLTGFEAFDSKAKADGIMGLTVPIVTENTTEAEGRNNPRAPFYKLYRFVLTDLNNGERYMYGMNEPDNKAFCGLGVIYGLQARLWQLLGTRFELHPEDLSTALSHEDDADIPYDKFGVTTARECFELAASYARKAINSGYSPVTETQWFDPTTGFNTVNNSWMWADIISSDDGLAKNLVWTSWVSFMSPEASYGIACSDYNGYRMIDNRLFDIIPDSDWRKTTWIAPDDVGKEEAFNTKYARGTSLGYKDWSKYQAYAGFKFHPANGDKDISTSGNAVSIPIMRVEEMYLIEAECTGRAYGVGEGRALLEAFVNGYRYKDGSYKSTGEGLEGLIDDVFTQKRIELWGEGQILWDYRRLEKAIIKGYPGTNWPELYRLNSLPNYVAPWTTFSLPQSERDYNPAVILNPDPSQGVYYFPWTEDE